MQACVFGSTMDVLLTRSWDTSPAVSFGTSKSLKSSLKRHWGRFPLCQRSGYKYVQHTVTYIFGIPLGIII